MNVEVRKDKTAPVGMPARRGYRQRRRTSIKGVGRKEDNSTRTGQKPKVEVMGNSWEVDKRGKSFSNKQKLKNQEIEKWREIGSQARTL